MWVMFSFTRPKEGLVRISCDIGLLIFLGPEIEESPTYLRRSQRSNLLSDPKCVWVWVAKMMTSLETGVSLGFTKTDAHDWRESLNWWEEL